MATNEVQTTTGFTIKWSIFAAIILLPFAFIALLDKVFDGIYRAEDAWRVRSAQVMYSDVPTSRQLPSTAWSDVEFPYRLENSATDSVTKPVSVWFRANLTLSSSPDDIWAVYIAEPDGAYAAFVNGSLVAESAPMSRPFPLSYEPLLLGFPASWLHVGVNQIEVRMVRESWTDSRQRLSIGPRNALSGPYTAMRFLIVTLRWITVIVMFAMSVTMFTSFRLRTADASLGWFALSLLVWAVHLSIRLNAKWSHIDPDILGNVERLTIGGYILCAAVFVQRFVGKRNASIDRIFVGWTALGAAVLLGLPIAFAQNARWFFDTIWFPPLLVVGAYVNYLMYLEYRKHANLEASLLFAISWCELVVGVIDQFVEVKLIAPRPYYLVYTAWMVLFAFGYLFLRRFLRASEAQERARSELELRVREKTESLEHNLVRMKDLEREQALSSERERIMRDMHDGVGGQLVQALSIASRHPAHRPIEDVLRHCLEELRLITDSIAPINGDLASVLGTMRIRMARRLMSAGIQVHWDVRDIPAIADFGPERVLQVMRIVQEAIANVLKHANARNISIGARLESGATSDDRSSTVVIEIMDDGRASNNEYIESGHGISNMKHRATLLGGQLHISAGAPGTKVTLRIPLPEVPNRMLHGTQSLGLGR